MNPGSLGAKNRVDDQCSNSTDDLLPENIFGHSRKVRLFRGACAELRSRRSTLRILDVGCGSGYAVTRFLGAPADEVLGIDLHEPNIRYATEHFSRPGLQFACRTAASVADSAGSFDVIVLADVLEHLDDPAKVLQESRKVLSPGGLLLVTVPNGYGPFEIESALSRTPVLGKALLKATDLFVAVLNKYGPLRGTWSKALSVAPGGLPYNAESAHVQFFTFRRLRRLIEQVGYRVTERRNISFLCGPFTNYLLGASPTFCKWNAGISSGLPPSLVSSWFLKCEVARP